MSALYPNDDWLMWMAEDEQGLNKEKAAAVVTYMSNKLRQQNFRAVLSSLIYDYIDYGNVFGRTEYVNEQTTDGLGNKIPVYTGPLLVRESPYDLVFNPLARSFDDSPKITRHLVSIGELELRLEEEPDNAGWIKPALEKVKNRRKFVSAYRRSDVNKAKGFSKDGFGSYTEYLDSGMVEIYNFEGNMYDSESGVLLKNHVITVLDGDFVLRKIENPSWIGASAYGHVSWRGRPDNVYGMGPLDNLVGMQYRIDHLENIKADLFDLIAHPPIKLKGNVESWDWGPFAEIYLGDDGEVDILKVDATALQADSQIAYLTQLMEEMAGAPKQSIGSRTPGEKTAFEVQTLEQNASKMFQERITHFEITFLEPMLNNMLELARRHMDGDDLMRVMDTDTGIQSFLSITPEDIKAKGRIRPIAARNFAARAQTIQNLQGALQMVAPDPGIRNHLSGMGMAEMVESGLNLQKHKLFRKNIQLQETMESQQLANSATNVLEQEDQTDIGEQI
jgi:hypothetical protein